MVNNVQLSDNLSLYNNCDIKSIFFLQQEIQLRQLFTIELLLMKFDIHFINTQNPNDEPAEKLLERIAELKKAKKTAKKRGGRKKKTYKRKIT